VIATKQDGTVAELVPQAGSVVATATGLTGAVIAAGVDTTGLYAWVDTTSGLVRARAGSPWAVDRGPIAAPFAPLDAAIAADGTLWIAISEPAQGNAAFISVQTLAPDATQLPAPERVDPTSHAGAITQAQLTLAGDGTHALVAATSTDSGTSTTLSPRLRTAAATWSDAPAVTGLVQYAFVGATLAALVNDPQGKTTSLLADATMPASAQVIPVWPMQSVGIVSDGTKVYPLIGNGSVTYALTPP
jgi:hypothetical protein